jgi:hypothetical protein
MKKILLAVVLLIGMGSVLMADLPIGTFGFDMKSTLKANGKADEQMTYLLKNMSQDINSVTVSSDKSVTLIGKNRKGKLRKENFSYKKVSKGTYEISAGNGIKIRSSDAKHLKLDLAMQNGKVIHLLYGLTR